MLQRAQPRHTPHQLQLGIQPFRDAHMGEPDFPDELQFLRFRHVHSAGHAEQRLYDVCGGVSRLSVATEV